MGKCKHEKFFVVGLLLLFAPLGLASALWWLPLIFWLWDLPAGGWQVLAVCLTGVCQGTPGRRAGPAQVVRRVTTDPTPAFTPAQQARYDDLRAKGWSELAARQTAEGLNA